MNDVSKTQTIQVQLIVPDDGVYDMVEYIEAAVDAGLLVTFDIMRS